MDPNATLARLLEATNQGEALEAAMDLLTWLASGGARPDNFQGRMQAAPALLDALAGTDAQ